ncbi:MAG: hypothetical protein KAT56_11180 [Sedimentisphaerales bacterium]|nr:hypothetical protein [Sedimentisphaerales bacterium]
MSKKNDGQNELEQIQLLRGGDIVSSLSGAFGQSLKETRITAILGYLVALAPDHFIKKFGFKGTALSISLETVHSQGRSDILITTTKGIGVIEAKADGTNPYQQAMEYKAKWRVLLTQYVPSSRESKLRNIRYMQWREIGKLLTELSKSSDPRVRFVSMDLLSYMEKYHMIKTRESVEIYAREINEPASLVLFLRAQLYGCGYEKNSRLPEALYFAPHFGQKISMNYPGVRVGLSYIARIETVEVVEKWQDLMKIIQSIRGKNWLNKHKSSLEPIHKKKDFKNNIKRSFLFLGEPRLVFNPPVKKDRLQKGTGWLSKKFFSFDELFLAWEGKKGNI